MNGPEIDDGQWTPADGYAANTKRRAVDPCGECSRGECRCEDDGDAAPEGEAAVRRRR